MQKFTFVVDIVTDSPAGIEPNAVRGTLLAAVDGIGNIAAVHPVKVDTLKEQGFKVWRARVAGITEESVNPKPVKVKAEKQAEVAAS
ncbi:MAG: hypothetical protein EBR82_44935 [Caulobacteraceae bacterium]|jgi:hypothetical protein|nr:hypothetical protein [Caulobacteraceae bacterium]